MASQGQNVIRSEFIDLQEADREKWEDPTLLPLVSGSPFDWRLMKEKKSELIVYS